MLTSLLSNFKQIAICSHLFGTTYLVTPWLAFNRYSKPWLHVHVHAIMYVCTFSLVVEAYTILVLPFLYIIHVIVWSQMPVRCSTCSTSGMVVTVKWTPSSSATFSGVWAATPPMPSSPSTAAPRRWVSYESLLLLLNKTAVCFVCC